LHAQEFRRLQQRNAGEARPRQRARVSTAPIEAGTAGAASGDCVKGEDVTNKRTYQNLPLTEADKKTKFSPYLTVP